MNRQASNLLNFIDSSFSGNHLALQDASAQHFYYQRLIYASLSHSICAAEGFQILGRQLAGIAHQAYSLRQIDTLDQASQIMLALPISTQLKGIAHYYQAICAKRKNDFDGALLWLESASEQAPQQYKGRVLLTAAAIYHARGEIDAALQFCVAAGKAATNCDLLTLVESHRDIAIIRSIQGDHKQALADLEQLFPIVRSISKRYPLLYYSLLNSLAVELGEVGRIEEAKAACSIALASPFAAAYPEIAQTRDELAAKRNSATPSIVAINRAPSSQIQPNRKAEPVRSLAISWLACAKFLFQRSAFPVSATAPTGVIAVSQNLLERVRYSINPRSPPSRF